MEVKITKINESGNVGIRDYIVNQAIDLNCDLRVIYDQDVMILTPNELKKGELGTREFKSDYSDTTYHIVYFKWISKKETSLIERLGPTWYAMLEEEFKKQYMRTLSNWLSKRRDIVEVFPKPDDVFNAFKSTPYDKVKVVFIGQDPYHSIGKDKEPIAHGYAFSSKSTIPPSLEVIFKELKRDLGVDRANSNLEDWAKQGVLLLNTILTVDKGRALTHKDQGWEQFTLEVIKTLNYHYNNLIFCLWGAEAQKLKSHIYEKHHILEAPHPAAELYGNAKKIFTGCGHFSKINEILELQGETKINW